MSQESHPIFHPTIMELRMLIQELREAEFKSGVLDHDVDLSVRKRALADALAVRIRTKLDAVEQDLLKSSSLPT